VDPDDAESSTQASSSESSNQDSAKEGSDDEDKRYNPNYKPAPGPRDELILAMDSCGVWCSLGVGMNFLLFGMHLYINME